MAAAAAAAAIRVRQRERKREEKNPNFDTHIRAELLAALWQKGEGFPGDRFTCLTFV